MKTTSRSRWSRADNLNAYISDCGHTLGIKTRRRPINSSIKFTRTVSRVEISRVDESRNKIIDNNINSFYNGGIRASIMQSKLELRTVGRSSPFLFCRRIVAAGSRDPADDVYANVLRAGMASIF